MPEYELHPSSFPQFEDCEKRAATRTFRDVIKAGGYQLRLTGSSIGAAVGAGTHAAIGHMLTEKMKTGQVGDLDEATEAGIEELEARMADSEVIWDETTKDMNTAEQQLDRMARSYARHVAPQFEPTSVEERLEADIGDGFILVGTTDQRVKERDGIRDAKTGVVKRLNISQYGGYSILNKIHGRPVGSILEDFIPRVRMSLIQPEPELTVYDVGDAERSAIRVINFIKTDLQEFKNRLSVNGEAPEDAFRSNPNSVLCSPKYCPAHGTEFCKIHRGNR